MMAPVPRNHFGDQIDKSDHQCDATDPTAATEAVVNPPD
jgi:hypothetical protein